MTESLLIVGSGGREHALGYRLSQSVGNTFFLPGNGGTLDIGENILKDPTDFEAIADIALQRNASTVVGPDLPLALGIVDYFEDRQLPIFGPSQAAARLESSKKFSADFNAEEGIPQADYVSFDDYNQAVQYVLTHDPLSFVIKADGLADGKGAVLPKDQDEALTCVYDFMVRKIHGKAGETILFQERLEGKELSVFALCDGENFIMLPSFRDHKRLLRDDKGPNTGGMGVYGPVKVSKQTQTIIEDQIIKKVLAGMQRRGTPYKGIIYAGLMLTAQGPKVIEYNARFGDPECQAQMLLAGSDLYQAIQEVMHDKLTLKRLKWRRGQVVTVALTADGYAYPNKTLRKGDQIFGLDAELPDDVLVFHHGTKIDAYDGHIVTNGGRVLHIAAFGETLALARQRAYSVIGEQAIHFAGMHYRDDIAEAA